MDSPSKKVKFLLRVDEETLDTLRVLAKTRQISLSKLLREVLDDYVKSLQPEVKPPPQREGQWWI